VETYWETIMKNRVKLVVLCGLMAFPMMVAFQNCSRTVAMQMTDEVNGKLDTDFLPNGTSEVDQQNPTDGTNAPSGGGDASQPVAGGDSGSGDSDPNMGTQVEDPIKELQDDVDSAAAECEVDLNESQNDANGVLSEGSFAGIRGSKVISAADLGGATELDELSDSYGKIVLCGVHVKSLHDTGGRIILVNSLVDDLSQHKGDIGVLESRAIISNSQGLIHKLNSDAPDVEIAGNVNNVKYGSKK
jgi:hypothetical protein